MVIDQLCNTSWNEQHLSSCNKCGHARSTWGAGMGPNTCIGVYSWIVFKSSIHEQ